MVSGCRQGCSKFPGWMARTGIGGQWPLGSSGSPTGSRTTGRAPGWWCPACTRPPRRVASGCTPSRTGGHGGGQTSAGGGGVVGQCATRDAHAAGARHGRAGWADAGLRQGRPGVPVWGDDEVVDLVSGGQAVIGLALCRVLGDVAAAVTHLAGARAARPVGEGAGPAAGRQLTGRGQAGRLFGSESRPIQWVPGRRRKPRRGSAYSSARPGVAGSRMRRTPTGSCWSRSVRT